MTSLGRSDGAIQEWLRTDDLDRTKTQHLEELLTELKTRRSTLLLPTLEWQLNCWQMRQALQTYTGARGNALFQRCFELHFPEVAMKSLLKALGKCSGWFGLGIQL